MSIKQPHFTPGDFAFILLRILLNAGILGAVFFLGVQSLPAADETGIAITSIQPGETGVLLLPALDATRDALNMQTPRQAVIRHRQQTELITRQFKVLGEALALKAAKISPAIELDQLSARTPENIDSLAKRAGATWVVHTVVEEVDANSDASEGFTINTRLLLQVWDVRRHDWVLNHRYTGQATGSGAPIMIFMRSLDNATKGALSNLLSAHPPTVTMEAENSLTDYLVDQTEPVTGDPGKLFRPVQSR